MQVFNAEITGNTSNTILFLVGIMTVILREF